MLRHASTQLPIVTTAVVTSVITATVFAAGPTIAQAAHDAVNADKVDGKHAVGAGASVLQRRGKLVATDGQGRLPNNIIATAPDANRLDGLDSTAFVQGTGTQVLSNRFVLTEGAPDELLLTIPELGHFTATCEEVFGANVFYYNTTGHPVDYWRNDGNNNTGEVAVSGNTGRGVTGTGSSRVNLGIGNLDNDHRVATVEVSALQTGDGQPCGFQVQAIYSRR